MNHHPVFSLTPCFSKVLDHPAIAANRFNGLPAAWETVEAVFPFHEASGRRSRGHEAQTSRPLRVVKMAFEPRDLGSYELRGGKRLPYGNTAALWKQVRQAIVLFGGVLLLAASALAAPSPTELDMIVLEASAYKIGDSRNALIQLEKLIQESKPGDATRRRVEQKIAEALHSNAPYIAKHHLCRLLWQIGADASLPALEGLLGNRETAHLACYALLQYPGKNADAALRRALDRTTGEVLENVISTLGRRRDNEAVRTLTSLVENQSPRVSATALDALGRIGTPEAARALNELRQAGDSSYKERVSLALLQCAQRLVQDRKPKPAGDIYRDLYRTPESDRVKRAALIGLAGLGGNEALDLVMAALADKDARLRATAIAQIPGLNAKGATERFAAELPKAAPETQALLIAALAERGEAAARTAVTALAECPITEVAGAALQALAKLGDATSVPVLVKAIAKGAPETHAIMAMNSLKAIQDKNASKAILDSLKSAAPAVKVPLAEVLVTRQAREAVPALLEQAAGEEPKSAAAAFRALGLLADAKQLDAVIQAMASSKAPAAGEAAERAILGILEKIPEAARRADPILLAYAKYPAPAMRCALLRILGENGGPTALDTVLAAIKDSDSNVRDTAVRALANWPDAAALKPMSEQARQAASPTHQVLLLRGCLRLLGLPSQRPPSETLAAYAEVLSLAKRPEEKKMALSGLAAAKVPGALKLAAPLLDEPAVQTEAALAVVQIIKQNPGDGREAAQSALQKAIPLISDPKLKKEAEGLLK